MHFYGTSFLTFRLLCMCVFISKFRKRGFISKLRTYVLRWGEWNEYTISRNGFHLILKMELYLTSFKSDLYVSFILPAIISMLLILFRFSLFTNNKQKLILFANNKRTNEQLTDFLFTPQMYLLNNKCNLFHIFPISFHLYVIDLNFVALRRTFLA